MFGAELNFLKALEGIRTDFLNGLFELITMLGEETILIVIMAVIYFMFDKDLAHRLFFITVVSLGANCIIKNFVKLPRPFTKGISCVRPDTATGYSFPSGHTQTFSTWSSAFSFKLKNRRLLVLSVILTALVGFSRMYLGAHYPVDVIVGGVLGFVFAFFGNSLYDKAQSKSVLYAAVLLILTPFAVFFLINPDPLYENLYKLYGMFAGFLCAVIFEKKYVALENNTSTLKKVLRVIICIAIALIVKECVTLLFTASSLRISLMLDAVRYFILVFILLGLCPLIFKKAKM